MDFSKTYKKAHLKKPGIQLPAELKQELQKGRF